jgi:hypothetical protein
MTEYLPPPDVVIAVAVLVGYTTWLQWRHVRTRRRADAELAEFIRQTEERWARQRAELSEGITPELLEEIRKGPYPDEEADPAPAESKASA